MIHNCPICGVNVDKMSDYDYGFHIIDCQEKRIAELEQELKNQVELHNEWLGFSLTPNSYKRRKQ